ncbi:uncharacterized protein [Hyperolius riggenbachi]|uniref:uncharacterized protein n=1 Tax=Hyperolius riggenbachi TaxID=752182 RepID=UPI0035A28333
MRTGLGHAMVIHRIAVSVLLFLSHTGSGLLVTAPSPHTALLQSRVELPCTFQVSATTINPQFLAIIWDFEQKELMRFDNKETVISEGVSFDVQKSRQGDASLTIPSVTVSSQGTYKCTVIYSPDTKSSQIELHVHAKPEVHIRRKVVVKDKDNQLHCSIINFFPQEITVRWLRNGKEFGAPEMTAAQRNADGTYRVNSSVVLPADQSQDQPTITCQVEHVSLSSPVQDSFKLQYGVAPNVRVSTAKSEDGNELIYVCEARGFSPQELSMNWMVDGKQLDSSGGRNGQLFNKEIYYRFNITDSNLPDHISCDVQHETLAKPTTKEMKIEQFNECRRNCHTGFTVFSVILSLVALGTAIFWWILVRKKKYFRVSHIYKDQTWSDEKVTLYCMAFRCPEVVQAVWKVMVEGRQPITVSDSRKDTDEEKALLSQHSDFTATTKQHEENGQRNATAMLSFNPSAAEYKKMDIKCSLTCGQRLKERTLQCSIILKEPVAADDHLKMYLNDSGDAVCSMVLEKFYPRDIQITWCCGAAQFQEMGTTEKSVTRNTDSTYNVLSECRIRKHLFQHSPEVMKVRVTWEHRAMSTAQSLEKDLADLPRCPVMGDISVPPLVHGKEARLQCDIQGYYPNDLDVKWFRREARKQELYEVSSNDKYKVPAMESTVTSPDSDKTFHCTAALIVSVSALTEEGSEFICRGTHSSLQKPLEKRTGELTVTGKPLINKRLQDGRAIIMEVGGFYTEDLVVTWERAEKLHGQYKEIKKDDIKESTTENSDGSYTHTSICKAMPKKGHVNPHDSYVKATVKHGSLRTPEKVVFLRSAGKFYLLENGKREELQKGDRKMLRDKKKI